MAATPTEPNHDPQFRTIDLSAEAKKILGDKWAAPEIAYEWSNGKKHYLGRATRRSTRAARTSGEGHALH